MVNTLFTLAAVLAAFLLTCHACLDEEVRSLLLFKKRMLDLNSSNYYFPTWKRGSDCCKNWLEVECNPLTHHVQSLRFSFSFGGDNLLVIQDCETILPLSNLQGLTSLDMGYNSLNLSLVLACLGKFPSLREINLGSNSEGSSISSAFQEWPSEALQRLTSLDLAYSHLSGSLPPQLQNMTSLAYLDLSANNFNSDFYELRSLSNLLSLETLDLSDNSLSGSIPCSLSNLSRLAHLRLDNNQLNGGTSCLVLPSSLREVRFGENRMEGTISEAFLSNLVELDTLDMTRSGLSMNVSNTWIPGFSCRDIRLGSCKINSSFPEWISTQPDLVYLDLSNTNLHGEIPSWLWELPSRDVLAGLNLSYNELEGHVSDLGHFGNVDLSFNNFKGSMPALFTVSKSSFYSSPGYLYLNLRNNGFEGPLTSDVAVEIIEFLDASNNKLTGPIPSVYIKCSNIGFLNLANNSLNGSLPIGFGGNFQNLQFLSLFNNKLEGTLPASLSASSALQFLNVGNNNFSGQFPKWITQLTELRILEMRSNRLEGNIPKELGTMQYLHFIDISSNYISGQIPKSISTLPRLSRQEQDFSNENYTTDFPMYSENIRYASGKYTAAVTIGTFTTFEEIKFYAKGLFLQYPHISSELACLDLSNNRLIGEIPTELGNLKGLVLLNLSRNHLTGSIPASIGDMSALEALDLSHNKLSGGIPTGFTRLDSMGFLNLSYNNLSGKIPRGGHMLTFGHQFFEGNPNLNDSLLLDRKRPKQTQTEVISEEESGGHDQEFWWVISIGVSFGVGFATFVSAWVLASRFKKYVNSSMDRIILWLFRYRY